MGGFAGGGRGASLLNDCKHGYSAKGNTLRLSLIRSSYYPDAHPNDRPQSARWAFVPHQDSWQSAKIVEKAEVFNHPVWTCAVGKNEKGELPAEQSMLSVSGDGVVVTGLKQAEDDRDLVVRFYESEGKGTTAEVKSVLNIGSLQTVNFIEDKVGDERGREIELRPWEIRTLKISTGSSEARAQGDR